MKTRLSLVATLAVVLCTQTSRGEEGGAGQFLPGSFSTMFEIAPSTPGFAVSVPFYAYAGDASAGLALPLGGTFALGLDASVYLTGFGFSYTFPETFLGAHYSVNATVPFLFIDVESSGQLNPALPRLPTINVKKTDSNSGLSDIVVSPVNLNWKLDESWQISFQLPLYLPTGDYTEGRLANLGKNIVSVGPLVGVNWLNPKIGLQVTSVMGLQFATENPATQYQNGIVFNWEGSIAQFIPLGDSTTICGGINWLVYQQITDDSGSGAKLGAFKGQLLGVGPTVSIVQKVGSHQVIGSFKWLPEIGTENRLQGDNFWVTLALAF